MARLGAAEKTIPRRKTTVSRGAGTTIRLGTQLGNVLFSVTDKQKRYINDLTASDVKVLEDGKPQEVFTFKRKNDLPIRTMAIYNAPTQ